MSQTPMPPIQQADKAVAALAASQGAQYEEDFFVYTTGTGLATSFAPIAPSVNNATASIQIEADSYFKIIKGSFFAWVEGTDPESTDATRPIPPITLTITDAGSGRRLTNNPVPVSSYFGDGRLPFIWPIPRIFLPRSSITFSANNLSTTDTWNLTLDLIGVKGYKQ